MSEASRTPPVAYPVPDDLKAVNVAFGAKRKHYLTREQLKDWYGRGTRFHEAAQSLFFNGGKLADHGLAFKPDIDRDKAMLALRALLCSFEPKHEIKIGTVAVALANWCNVADQKERT